jgi:hypothetical protein
MQSVLINSEELPIIRFNFTGNKDKFVLDLRDDFGRLNP